MLLALLNDRVEAWKDGMDLLNFSLVLYPGPLTTRLLKLVTTPPPRMVCDHCLRVIHGTRLVLFQ